VRLKFQKINQVTTGVVRLIRGYSEMAKPRILFMGTPAFALPALRALHQHQYPIIGVVTQPDRPKGRGLKEVMGRLQTPRLARNVFLS